MSVVHDGELGEMGPQSKIGAGAKGLEKAAQKQVITPFGSSLSSEPPPNHLQAEAVDGFPTLEKVSNFVYYQNV